MKANAQHSREAAKDLERDLEKVVEGEVRFDPGSRALYATAGGNYRQVPIGVVIPKHTSDVIQTVSICKKYEAPVLPRGGGTSLAGQCCNVAVVIDMSKYMNQVLELNPTHQIARVQPGTILDHLRSQAENYHLTFAPDPSTHNHCTLGGMIGNNSCGVHSVMGGKTVDNVIDLDVLTYDGLRMKVGPTNEKELADIITEGGRRGEIYSQLRTLRDKYAALIREKYPKLPRRVSGYNLDELLPENGFNVAKALVGTEGTCVTVLEATTRLVYSPPVRALIVLGYPDVYTAGDHVTEILQFQPIGLEGLDDRLVQDMIKKKLHPERVRVLPEGRGWLLVELGGATREEVDEKAKKMMATIKGFSNPPSMKLFEDPQEELLVWKVRESGLGATARVPGSPDTWEGWEDAAVPPGVLGNYLRDFRKLLNKYKYACCLYGHFGGGCVHTRIDFDLETHQGIGHYNAFIHEAADLVIKYGGSLSGEHGDGQSRAELLPKMFGKELIEAFNQFKSIWDPAWKMNPGKKVKPFKAIDNLRLGENYRPRKVSTSFKFPTEEGSFARATTRCVGVGECRRMKNGVMCPSFKVTREEKHSTRGRARLLFEMLEGDPLTHLWREKSILDALDLCLACKGCKSDCPVNVDMATYKAEFLSHYYKRRLRPVSAYSMGLIYWWARIASYVPRLANFVTHAPGLRNIAKVMAGLSQKRQIPKFAMTPFKREFARRPLKNIGKPKVVLWVDTFNNHFFPNIAMAAVEVLESAGFQVIVPEQSLCCGRPLYDFGMLNLAKGLLRQVLDTLRPYISEGISMVGLEPSCIAVFRDEMVNLFPDDEDAKRLFRQTFMLSEFLQKKAADFQIPKIQGKALVQGHCHHRSVMGVEDEEKLLKRIGLDVTIPDTGCCGMAGAFGFERKHFDIAMKVGESALLPLVRKQTQDTIIVTSGFSCHEQIAQGTDRKPVHLAEVVRYAIQLSSKESSSLRGLRRDLAPRPSKGMMNRLPSMKRPNSSG